eukprot:COSAG05_NODE_2329_length_3229_cov_14.334185_4_plen_106_part_01
MEPSFLADVDPLQKQELLTLLSQATRHYGSVTRDVETDVANKFGLSPEEVAQVITWAEGGQTPMSPGLTNISPPAQVRCCCCCYCCRPPGIGMSIAAHTMAMQPSP